MFFDGEEAFVEWSPVDSTYGSRRLAKTLKQEHGSTAFDSIDLFVLLDLIGGDQQRFLNYFPAASSNVYSMLSSIETHLRQKNLLSKKFPYYFADTNNLGRMSGVEDDHIPFLREGTTFILFETEN
jgi:glutaminyl-peptide cyclotransferase